MGGIRCWDEEFLMKFLHVLWQFPSCLGRSRISIWHTALEDRGGRVPSSRMREDIFLTRRIKTTSPYGAKTGDVLNSVFLHCDAHPHCVEHALWHHPSGAWWTREIEVNMKLILLAVSCGMKSSVSASWVLCLLPAHVTLWRANMSASK